MTLVLSSSSGDPEIDELRSKGVALEKRLTERAAHVQRVQSALAAFRIRYRQEVGLLHEELDELERAISDAELGEIAKDPDRWTSKPQEESGGPRRESPPRFTTDAVRRLFREVAKAIHPDLAGDEGARERRHSLMIEANRAYSLGDEERLRSILESWEKSPEAIEGSQPGSVRLRLLRRISQMEEELAALDVELDALKQSPMWQLKRMVDDAGARGHDLMRDTVRRLKRDILVARNRLDAIRSTP